MVFNSELDTSQNRFNGLLKMLVS
ncbi:hypothetical protein SBA4_970001 [Candidatus Sulfopaludibacter sp. SbA4]|nr:hypothetical protein SBA4_970001 [Candidatus Sulfopaludibacter sp. SbA4]